MQTALCSSRRKRQKRQRTAALQDASAPLGAARNSARSWSAQALWRFSQAGAASVLVLVLVCVGCLGVHAAGPDPAASTAPIRSLPGQNLTNQAAMAVPAPPGTRSPASFLAELLAMTPAERERSLSDRTPEQRAVIEKGLRKFEALPATDRNARLHEMDLTWHVDSLMKLPPAKRGARLATVPTELRPVVEERLRVFDSLPADKQKEFLAYPTTANFLLGAKPSAPPLPGAISGPPVPEDNRKVAEHLSQFLELSGQEQQKALEALPPEERAEMAQTLRAFAGMPAEQRRICVSSFERFSRLSKNEREQFLKNAARWKAMSPRERETWRALVDIMPPVGLTTVPPPTPPGETVAGTATASNSAVNPSTPGTQEKGH